MLHSCIEGIALGFGLAIMLGPAFFSLIQTSLQRGFYAAMRLAFGVFLSDTFLVFIAFLGASKLFALPAANHIVGLVGGAVLIGYGIYTYKAKTDIEMVQGKTELMQLPSNWTYFVKGFFANMANPATWLFWIFWVGIIMGRNTVDGQTDYVSVAVFFTTALLTVLSTDLIKSFVAHKIKPYMNNKTMRKINKIIGVFLFLFGVYLMLMVVLELFGVIASTTTSNII